MIEKYGSSEIYNKMTIIPSLGKKINHKTRAVNFKLLPFVTNSAHKWSLIRMGSHVQC